MLYTEEELTAIRAQQKKRWLCLLIPVAVMLVGIVAVLIIRGQRSLDDTTAQIIVDILTILIGVAFIGGWGLFIKPLRCYERHIDGLLHGRTHVCDDGTFAHLEEDESVVDGVAYYAMTLHCLDEKQKPYERLFYYDALKPRPDFREGEALRVTYHDRFVGQVERI